MREFYLRRADENLPEIKTERIRPDIKPCVMDKGDKILIDLGNHYVGYFSFVMERVDLYIDAPVRMRVKFYETKGECEDDYDEEYRGWICQSWIQEEIINVDFPGEYKMPRRYATRYIGIEILCTPKRLVLSDFAFDAVSCADMSALKRVDIADPRMRDIDRVAVNTLKNCMQRVFEDGPKRDRRLWIGDLRLEALANYYTFDNRELVKRCLYLFAASEKNEHGFMPGFVYENPYFFSGSWFLVDYSLFYVCSLSEYYLHTGDIDTFLELYPVGESIMEAAHRTLDEKGLVCSPTGDEDIFIDWCEGLEKKTALEGVYLYTLGIWCDALHAAKKAEENSYRVRLAKGRADAKAALFDEGKRSFINSKDNYQHSVHSNVWGVLGGIVEGDEARAALTGAINSPDSLKPFTPYMHHYTVEALFKAGLNDVAESYMLDIWGGMLDMGADTFFEAYSAGDPAFSPYDDRRVNSMCHAWSCTPTYFIRKYGLGFKK